MSDQQKRYPFLFTALPHGFTDSWMGRLSPEATVVMLAFYRETIGWDRTEAAVSYPTLQAYTGIASYTTIRNAIQELCNAGLLQIKEGEHTQRNGVIYRLGPNAWSFTPDVKVSPSKDGVTFTPDVKLPLHHMEKYPYKPRKSSLTPHVKRKPPQKHRHAKPKAVPEGSEQGAKERLKEPSKRKEKELPPSAALQAGAPNVAPHDVVEKEEQEEPRGREDAAPIPSKPSGNTMQAADTRQRSREVPPTAELPWEADNIAVRWWERVKEDMRVQISATTWQSWFPGTQGLRLEGNTLVVHATSGAQDQFEHRFKRDIAAILRGAARPGIEIRYTHEEG